MITYFKNIYKYRELVYALFQKQFATRYKQSLLGPAWAIIQPVVLMIVFVVIKSAGVVKIENANVPYAIFVYAALVPWTFFTNSLSVSASSIVANSAVIKKIYYPREVFPTAAILASFFDFCFAAIVYVGLMFYFKVFATYHILLIPVLLIIQSICALSVGLVGSSLGVYRRDFIRAMDFTAGFLLFLTPVMYSIDRIPSKYMGFYLWFNPMAGIIESYRSVLVYHRFPPLMYIIAPLIVTLLMFTVAYRIFKVLEKHFADVV